MNVLVHITVFIAAFFATEIAAWFSHKYIMHGFMWAIHKDHHTGSKHAFEKNDWFSVIFAFPSFLLIYGGLKYNYPFALTFGAGMALYGLAYFLVHDVFIHQRVHLFRTTNNSYFKALRRAHKMHHKQVEKGNSESFGFLIVSKKYFQSNNSLFEN